MRPTTVKIIPSTIKVYPRNILSLDCCFFLARLAKMSPGRVKPTVIPQTLPLTPTTSDKDVMKIALSDKTGTQKKVVAQNNALGLASLNPSSEEMKLFLPASKTKGNVVITETQVAIQTACAPE